MITYYLYVFTTGSKRMKLLTLKQSGAVLAIGAVIVASFANVAIAKGGDNEGTLQPVWCKMKGKKPKSTVIT